MGWGYNQHVGDISWGYQECFQKCGLGGGLDHNDSSWFMVYHDRQHLMGVAYRPTRWKFVEQQVVFEVIVQPYNVGLSCGGRSERKQMSLARGFSRFGEIVSNWDMKLYHALPTSSSRLMYKMIENPVKRCLHKNVPTNPQTISPSFGLTWLDAA
jgi:hypothetical protein